MLMATSNGGPIFTDGDGILLKSLTADTLVTKFAYRNTSSFTEKLSMYVAVYDQNGRLKHLGADMHEVVAGESAAFRVSLNLLGNTVDSGYYAKVFIWDSMTYVPVTEPFTH